MMIQFSNTIVFIPDWVIISLVLIIPSWFLSRWDQKKGILKFKVASFFNFALLLVYMLFSRDSLATFLVFHVSGFFVLFLIFLDYGLRKKITVKIN